MKRHFRFYRVGQSWVLSFGWPGFGLIHLAHHRWWKPLAFFPHALLAHIRILRRAQL